MKGNLGPLTVHLTYVNASQYHASRKGWHKKDSVRERISDPDILSIPELLAAEKGTASLAKLIQRMIPSSQS